MQSSFYLGINQLWDELLVMQKPGLYWLNIDRQEDAVVLCRQTVGRQLSDAEVAFISVDSDPRDVISSLPITGLNQLPLFSLSSSRQALIQLPDDLMRSLKPRDHLLVLHSPATLWKSLAVSELVQWLKRVNNWLIEQNNTLLILCYGLDGETLRPHLLAQHRELCGVSNLIRVGDDLNYQVDFWCNNLGVSAKERLNVILDSQGLRNDNTINQAKPEFVSDEDLYLSVKSVLEGKPAPSGNWHLFNNNEELAAAGEQVRASTLIFTLEKREQVDSLVYQIYHLRRQRGNGIKIAVKAMTPSLRSNDEYVLMACGANVVTSYTVPLDKFIATLTAIQGEIFSRYIPGDIENLLKAVKPLPMRGYVDKNIFSQSIISLMNNALLPEDSKGVLISFLPVSGLTAKQALTLCSLRRDGDLVTLLDKKLILFLSSCKVNELNSTLRFIFKLPVEQVFSEHSVWSRDRDILAKMYQLQQMPSVEPELNDKIVHQGITPDSHHNEPNNLSIHIPEAITLAVKYQEPQP